MSKEPFVECQRELAELKTLSSKKVASLITINLDLAVERLLTQYIQLLQ